MLYEIVQIIYANDRLFLLWFDDENTGVLTLQQHLVFSRSIAPLIYFSDNNDILLNRDSISHFAYVDFSELLSWLDNPTPDINCAYFVDSWNMLSDILESCATSGVFCSQSQNEDSRGLYNKLFWGANLPGYTPSGKINIPDWHFEDLCLLQSLLRAACHELAEVIRQGQEQY